ncbi:hypothetical protein EG328_010585 [Venturia inaequalis]|uniref:Uncharacterized protein n=1 Tax=Venturia inaequalis TaxID=5025 RepID=A0A8H3V697_VENIN|nr:hypothetical protein EG328_010585 [Venturia inaequalis]
MVSRICTLFYRRPLVYFTILPIQTIISFRNDPDSSKLERAVRKFREGKLKEQKIVNIAGTLSAAATIGVFSWPELATTHWYAKALWYSSLVLAIFSLIGLSQSRLTEAVSCIEEREASEEEKKAALRVFVDPDDTSMDDDGESPMSWYTRNMVFVWQWTLMVMVWSWVTFLMALLLHIIKPFLPTQNPKTADRNVGRDIFPGCTDADHTHVYVVRVVDGLCDEKAQQHILRRIGVAIPRKAIGLRNEVQLRSDSNA